ncbi:MAG: polyphenol oxidase family protein [Bacteriovoracaceae bacterium]|jgi:polyphenol oxidase|nr:polyphenol oxidase family protein [Bacteriovoracaceae bacterium]
MKPIFQMALSRGVFRTYAEKPEFDIRRIHQVHGDKVIELGTSENSEQIKADGMAVIESGTLNDVLCIITADCLPIAIEGEKGVAMVHAGWRGVHANILSSPMIKKIVPTNFFIGPHIGPLSYEVGSEFKEHFPDGGLVTELENKLYFNLALAAIGQINSLYPKASVSCSGICTFCDNNFHSYRRNNTTQRNFNVYIPNHLVAQLSP